MRWTSARRSTHCDAVANRMRRPACQARIATPVAWCVFPVSGGEGLGSCRQGIGMRVVVFVEIGLNHPWSGRPTSSLKTSLATSRSLRSLC